MNSLVSEEESKQRLLDKAHLKREHYRVLGRRAEDITLTRDSSIYNDFDFYQLLLKDFLASADSGEGEDGRYGASGGGDADVYLDGADLGLTQRFLERKKRLEQGQGEKANKKEVDRKASKNRKIRYVVHPKLVNFMTPLDDLNVSGTQDGAIHARQSLLLSMFGQSN